MGRGNQEFACKPVKLELVLSKAVGEMSMELQGACLGPWPCQETGQLRRGGAALLDRRAQVLLRACRSIHPPAHAFMHAFIQGFSLGELFNLSEPTFLI